MNLAKFAVVTLLATAAFSLSGCGDGGNTVIQPTETFQPTETQQQAEKEFERQRDEQDRAGR